MDLPFIQIGGRIISTKSDEGKELMKWETHDTYQHQPFPQMLYRPRRCPDGVVRFAVTDAEGYDQQSCLTVPDATARQKAFESGWRATPQEALDAFEAKQQAIAETTAQRHYEDRNMSEPAKAEARVADDASEQHVPEVKRKRGRPRKIVNAT